MPGTRLLTGDTHAVAGEQRTYRRLLFLSGRTMPLATVVHGFTRRYGANDCEVVLLQVEPTDEIEPSSRPAEPASGWRCPGDRGRQPLNANASDLALRLRRVGNRSRVRFAAAEGALGDVIVSAARCLDCDLVILSADDRAGAGPAVSAAALKQALQASLPTFDLVILPDKNA